MKTKWIEIQTGCELINVDAIERIIKDDGLKRACITVVMKKVNDIPVSHVYDNVKKRDDKYNEIKQMLIPLATLDG